MKHGLRRYLKCNLHLPGCSPNSEVCQPSNHTFLVRTRLFFFFHSFAKQGNLIFQQCRNESPNRELRPVAIHKLNLRIFMTLHSAPREDRIRDHFTCHNKKSLNLFTPLVRISKSGLGQSFVYKFCSMVPSSIASTSSSPDSTAATISRSE